ncbi:MAG: DUF4488 domain-containing protein [Flavobacteriaceae bacterium]
MRLFFILSFLSFSLLINTQTEQIQIPDSESIVGIWRQTGIENPFTGEFIATISGNYKVISPDGTFFTFVTWPSNDPKKGTAIGQYGNYEVKSDSIMIEKIIKHVLTPNLSGKNATIKYNLVDKETLMMAWENEKGFWINEEWTRLPLSR